MKNFSHTWWNTQVREYSTSILERDKILRSLRKYERIEANTGGQGQGWLPICWSHYWERGNIIKRMCWNRRVRLLCTLHLRFGYDIKNGRKFIQKTDFWFKKSQEEFGQLQTSKRKSWKLKFDGLLLSKRYIPSAKTYRRFIQHYFQLLVWKFAKWLMSFLKPYVIFDDTAALYFF